MFLDNLPFRFVLLSDEDVPQPKHNVALVAGHPRRKAEQKSTMWLWLRDILSVLFCFPTRMSRNQSHIVLFCFFFIFLLSYASTKPWQLHSLHYLFFLPQPNILRNIQPSLPGSHEHSALSPLSILHSALTIESPSLLCHP